MTIANPIAQCRSALPRDSIRSWSPRWRWECRGVCGVGKAEAGITGCALGQGRGQNAGELVVVVVDLGGGLAVVRTQDAAGVLDEPSLLGDGRGEEESVQCGAVESLPGVR